ncbi:helix-hairpin-helix domain-containing protein [Nocardioides sp. JQ2195]|uniref:helix-hairpin-helix domain-containing protein n=1 Tax=Nocardioides sp. JQ2195 TaxID=2592334 RepID=UPI00143E3D67|nr:helix-hairpin-helix domain-containing protein [Nocardioides sp. JQ2195]QIX27087.1 helix-hairpin-helix domain-containing protein [Nocardioides sp. JQ2195]
MSLQHNLIDRGKWYYTLTIASCGLFAWVPFLHAASRLKGRGLGRLAAIFGAGAAISTILISAAPNDPNGDPTGPLSTVGAILTLALMIFACVKLSPIRAEIYPDRYAYRPAPVVDASIQNALAAREHRAKARQIAENDPSLARDLRIGRPDLQREYYDGGLVDLNNAPKEVIAKHCGLPDEAAERIVSHRALYSEGFSSVEEVIVVSDQTATHAGFLRDRGVVLPR